MDSGQKPKERHCAVRSRTEGHSRGSRGLPVGMGGPGRPGHTVSLPMVFWDSGCGLKFIILHHVKSCYKTGAWTLWRLNQAAVAHAWNPRYLEGCNWEDCSTRPSEAKSLPNSIRTSIIVCTCHPKLHRGENGKLPFQGNLDDKVQETPSQ